MFRQKCLDRNIFIFIYFMQNRYHWQIYATFLLTWLNSPHFFLVEYSIFSTEFLTKNIDFREKIDLFNFLPKCSHENLDIWWKFQCFIKLLILGKNCNFQKNFGCWAKFCKIIFTKNSIIGNYFFYQNFNYWQKKYFVYQNFNSWQINYFLTKILIS